MNRSRKLGPLIVLAALVAGCSSEPVDSATTGTSGNVRDKGVKFAECVRQNGVSDFPDPDANGDFQYGVSVSPEVWTRAVEACKELQPPGTLSGNRTPEQQAVALKFAQCVRDNGVDDFPDPANGEPLVDTNKIPSSAGKGGMAVLNAVLKKCEALRSGAVVGPK